MMKNDEILLVDDTPANLEVLIEILSSSGYETVAAPNGKRALALLQRHLPDLILLDIRMPDIDGFELCQYIKDNPNTANIPVIFMTVLSDDDSIERGFLLGAVDYICKPIKKTELLSRVKNHLNLQHLRLTLEQQIFIKTRDLEAMVNQLQQALNQLQDYQERMLQSEKMATHDPLTELPNRRLLVDRLDSAIARSHKLQQAIALLYIDLDGFKAVNDTYGHQTGDELLVQVSRRLQSILDRNNEIFRLGGDEFVVLVEHVEAEASIVELARQLLVNLQNPFTIENHRITIGGSVGIKMSYPYDYPTVNGLIAEADAAMYQAKQQKNGFVLHGKKISDRSP